MSCIRLYPFGLILHCIPQPKYMFIKVNPMRMSVNSCLVRLHNPRFMIGDIIYKQKYAGINHKSVWLNTLIDEII